MTSLLIGLVAVTYTRRSLLRRKTLRRIRNYAQKHSISNDLTSHTLDTVLPQLCVSRLYSCRPYIDGLNTKSLADSLFMCTSNEDAKKDLSQSMQIYEDFITEQEEISLMKEIEPYMRRLRYEEDHWDDAIHGYRETERRNWNEENSKILKRVQDVAFPPPTAKLAYVHILDLQKTGYIKPHIDAVRFCGNTIAGLSLLSSSVMRLVHDKHKDRSADFLLKQRSLYIMRDTARYDYTHEVLDKDNSSFKGEIVPRDRRISVILRNEPDPKREENFKS